MAQHKADWWLKTNEIFSILHELDSQFLSIEKCFKKNYARKSKEKLIKYIRDNIKVIVISFSGTRIGEKEINLTKIIKDKLNTDKNYKNDFKTTIKRFVKDGIINKLTKDLDNNSMKIKDKYCIKYGEKDSSISFRLILKDDLSSMKKDISELLNNINKDDMQSEIDSSRPEFIRKAYEIIELYQIVIDRDVESKLNEKLNNTENAEKIINKIDSFMALFDISEELLNNNDFVLNLIDILVNVKSDKANKVAKDIEELYSKINK